MKYLRRMGGILVLALLAACADPAAGIKIRPGITSSTDLDALRPPSGVTYRYTMESKDVPIPVTLTLRSKRRSAKVYDYTGTMALTLPDQGNLEEVGNLVAESFGVSDVKFRGNSLIFPVSLRADNRFRSLSSELLFMNSRYIPHDCFAVLGTCRYKSVEKDGQSIALVSKTKEENGIWRSETRPDPSVRQTVPKGGVQRAIYSLDRNGVMIDLILTRTGAGAREAVVLRRQ